MDNSDGDDYDADDNNDGDKPSSQESSVWKETMWPLEKRESGSDKKTATNREEVVAEERI